MTLNEQETLTPRQQWKGDTDSLFEKLIDSNDRGLKGRDRIGWLLHTIGRLQSGRYDRFDLDNIIDSLQRQVDDLIAAGRSHFRIAIKSLLLLRFAPVAGSSTRRQWKDAVAYNRMGLQMLFRDSPAALCFVEPMLRYAWPSGRGEAWTVLTYGNYIPDELRSDVLVAQQRGGWNQRLPEDCPWDAQHVLGFAPTLPIILPDAFQLPFDEPHVQG